MPQTIRRAKVEDLPALRQLHMASWRATPAYAEPLAGQDLDGPATAFWTEPRLAQMRVWVAICSENLAGFLAAHPVDTQGTVKVSNLHVAPAFRGKGLGGALLSTGASAALSEGASRLTLLVLAANSGARRFYSRHGGHEGQEQDEDLFGTAVRAVRMDWDGKVELQALAGASPQLHGAGG